MTKARQRMMIDSTFFLLLAMILALGYFVSWYATGGLWMACGAVCLWLITRGSTTRGQWWLIAGTSLFCFGFGLLALYGCIGVESGAYDPEIQQAEA